MRKKKVTMADIATAVGVSQPTVSAILNDSDTIKVSDATKLKVLEKARELGYVLKQPMRHSSSHPRIALIVNSLNMHDPFINAISAAKTRAWELDYILSVFDYEEDEQLRKSILNEIIEGGFQSVIYATNTPKTNINVTDLPTIPTVLLNCTGNQTTDMTAVIPADYLGGYKATEFLIQKKYQKIAMVTGESWDESSNQRLRGFKQALINADISIRNEWIVEGNWSVKQSYLQTMHLLESSERPDAIFCASDLMAVGCYQAICRKGLHIPRDIALIGYDNQLLASELTPMLTSVDLPYDEMGRKAVEILCHACEEEILPVIKVEGDIYIRESA